MKNHQAISMSHRQSFLNNEFIDKLVPAYSSSDVTIVLEGQYHYLQSSMRLFMLIRLLLLQDTGQFFHDSCCHQPFSNIDNR